MKAKRSQLLIAMGQVCDLAEAKDIGHSQRVMILVLTLALKLQMVSDHERLAELVVAALLHDIGISSITYDLHERTRGKERSLLVNYPSIKDGLFGSDSQHLSEESNIRFIIQRHAEIGAQMLQRLHYSDTVSALVEHHHAPQTQDELAPLFQLLTLADHLDTATLSLKTAEERRQHALSSLPGLSPLISTEIIEAARPVLDDAQLWEDVLDFHRIRPSIDEIFSSSMGLEVNDEEIDQHLRILAQVIDAPSPYMAGHTLDVTRLARRIGEHIGLDPDTLHSLYFAGLIHGTGRLGIPSSILEKAGGLSESEFTILHTYPRITRRALDPLQSFQQLIDDASTHREKLDGSGYPQALRDTEIPLIGRILAVADTFSALTSDRPYRSGYSSPRALALIQSESPRLFDGLMTDALGAIYREGF